MIAERCMREKKGRRVKTNQGRMVTINLLWARLKTKQGDRKESKYRYRNSLVFRLVKLSQKNIRVK